MSHYEQRIEKDLADIRARIAAVGEAVCTAAEAACRALQALDRAQAAEVIVGDMQINRAVREIDRRCHLFVARHLPSAGILRFISSVLRLTIAIERIGDYAATISRQTVQISKALPSDVLRDVELMSEPSVDMLRRALGAFIEGNADVARGTMAMAKQVDSSYERVFADLLKAGETQSRPVGDIFAVLMAFNRIERISDQAKNICEETVFAVTGETKEPKVFRVLFVDGPNACWSPMAAAVAAKGYPQSGVYSSAGWDPAEALDEKLVAFLDRKGLAPSDRRPTAIPTTHDELDDYHLIVNLDSGLRDHLADLPFKTVLLDWDLIPAGDVTDEALEAVYKQLAAKIGDLMTRLRGEDAE